MFLELGACRGVCDWLGHFVIWIQFANLILWVLDFHSARQKGIPFFFEVRPRIKLLLSGFRDQISEFDNIGNKMFASFQCPIPMSI